MSDTQYLPRRSTFRSGKIAVIWQSLLENIFDAYRPELHYMRGPGPKWRAKHSD
jgi:hypothetical protein